MTNLIADLGNSMKRDDVPDFRAGDTVKVHVKVVEGTRSRVQIFQGVVIRVHGSGVGRTFTVRKVSFGVGVERTFPLHSPIFEQIEIVTRGDVRRAKLYYLRNLRGKAAKIKERRTRPDPGSQPTARYASRVIPDDRDQSTTVVNDESDSRPSHAAEKTKKQKKKHLPLWQETILLLGVALLLAVVIKALFVQAFYIPSESMEPGLVQNDRILVQKMSYWFGDSPERGDVVVFKDPGGWLNATESAGPSNPVAKVMAKVGLYPEGGHLVKRVIGVEGDVIECCDKRGRISVNGTPLNENVYVKNEAGVPCRGPMPAKECNWSAGPVPEGHIFVDGRQPQPLGGLVGPPVHRREDRVLRQPVRAGRPGRRQGLRPALAGRPLPVGPASRHLRGRAQHGLSCR